MINDEKYIHIDTFHQLYPIYDNGLFAPVYITVPTINIPTPMETTDDDEVMKDDITAIKISYDKPCMKLADECLHESTASCPFCDKSDLDVKRKRSRPRKLSIVTQDGENRKYKANVEYMKRRYRDDEEFKTKCLQNGKINYIIKKQEQEIKNMLSKKQLKSLYNRKYRNKQKNNQD